VPPTIAVPIALVLVALFRPFEYATYGLVRGLLLVTLGGLVAWYRPRPEPARPRLTHALGVLVVLALCADVVIGASVVADTWRNGRSRFDQAENVRAAVTMLVHGENPYGNQAVIDTMVYAQLHVGQKAPPAHRDLSATERAALLAGDAHPDLYGHKYGPLNVIFAVPFVLAAGAAGVALLNVLLFLAFVAIVARILRQLGVGRLHTVLVLAALAVDPVAVIWFVRYPSQDIESLVACAAALSLALDDRPYATALAVAIAIATKVVPGVLFVPLLLQRRRWPALAVCAAATLAFHLPFLLWDAHGLYVNLFGWSLTRPPDETSWIYFAPPLVARVARAGLGVAALGLVARMALVGVTVRALALLTTCVLCAASTMHNNYVPWLAWLVYLALVDPSSSTAATASVGSGGGASPSRLRADGSSIISTLT
jgi:hypothetical protein